MRSLVDAGTRRRMAQGGNKQEAADILNVSHPQNTRKRESEEAMAELARQAQELGMGYE